MAEEVSVRFTFGGGRQLLGFIDTFAARADRAALSVDRLAGSVERLGKVRTTPPRGLEEISRLSDRATDSVRRTGGAFRDIQNPITGAARGLGQLRSAFQLVAGAFLVRETLQLADSFTQLENRLRTVTEGEQQLADTTQALFRVSQDTRSSFQGTVELFTRSSLAARELGLSQEELVGFTKSLNQAVILSGASAQEANAAIIQLSQGIASGTLRGDELRSVLEQLPIVADVIARSLGVTRGELRQLGFEGKISARDIVRAFAEAKDELEAGFGESVGTLSQAFERLKNASTLALAALDKQTGTTQGLAGATNDLADSLERLANATPRENLANFLAGKIREGGIAGRGLELAVDALASGEEDTLFGQKDNGVLFARSVQERVKALEGFQGQLDQARVSADSFAESLRRIPSAAQFLPSESILPRPAASDARNEPTQLSTTGALGIANRPTLKGAFDEKEFEKIRAAALPAAEAVRQLQLDTLQLAAAFESGAFGDPNSAEAIRDRDRVLRALTEASREARLPIESLLEANRREISLAGLSADEREREARVLGQIESLKGRGVEVSGRLAARLREEAFALQQTNREQAVRDDLTRRFIQPSKDLATAQDVVAEAIRAGSITAQQGALFLAEFEESLARAKGEAIDFADPVAQIRREFEALSNIPLNLSEAQFGAELEIARTNLQRQQRGQRPLSELEEDEIRGLRDQQTALEAVRAEVERFRAPADQFVAAQRAIIAAGEAVGASQEEIQARLRQTRIELLETDRTIQGGLVRGLERLRQDFADTGRSIEEAFRTGAEGAADALTTFLAGGKADLAQFAQEVNEAVIRALVVEPLLNQAAGALQSVFPSLTESLGGVAAGAGRGFSAVAGAATPALDAANAAAGAADAAALSAAATAITTSATASSTAISTSATSSAAAISTAATTAATALTGAASALSGAAGAIAAAAGSEAASGLGSALGTAATAATVTAATGFQGTVQGRAGTDANLVTIAATRGEEITVRTPAQQSMGPVPGFERGGQIRRRFGFDEILFAEANGRAVREPSSARERSGPRERPIEQRITNITNNVRQEIRNADPDQFRFTQRQLRKALGSGMR